jgi:hypothetical protein
MNSLAVGALDAHGFLIPGAGGSGCLAVNPAIDGNWFRMPVGVPHPGESGSRKDASSQQRVEILW